MANEHFEQLRADVGLVHIVQCTSEESNQFAAMERNAQPLPANVNRFVTGEYVRLVSKAPSGKEELYVLMRMSKDLRFFKKLTILGIVLVCVSLIISLVIGISLTGMVKSVF